MKLLLINSRFLDIGGGETYMMELMDHFSSIGWEVHLATRTALNPISTWNGCQIHYIDGLDDLDLRPSECLAPMRQLLDKVQPDVVHVHSLMNFYAYSSIVKKGEYSAILTIHDTPLLPERLFGRLKDYRTECVFADELLSNGKYSKVTFASQYYLSSYVELFPWMEGRGVVAYGFPAQVSAGPLKPKDLKENGEIKILFPSRIVERKGIEDCLRMLAILPERFKLLLPAYGAGDNGEYLKLIDSLIDELGIRQRITAPQEKTSPAAMAQYYEMADIALMPAHYEGFGLVAVESMSWGVPIIATPVGGLAEIITDGKDGIMVAPHAPEELAEAVMKLAENPTLRRALTDQGFNTIRSKFTRETHMKQMEKIYVEA